MKKVLLVSVLLGGLMVGCSQAEKPKEQFNIVCLSNDDCTVEYIKHGEVIDYEMSFNERLYFNYPDEGRIVINYYNMNSCWVKAKIYSNNEIVSTDLTISVNANEIILK